MKFLNPFKTLKPFEQGLWISSMAAITLVFFFTPNKDVLSLIASLIGATALIFVAKGNVFGQVLTVCFSLVYALVSFKLKYYGEMITYLFMTAPIAIVSVISWVKNPFKGNKAEVTVKVLEKKEVAVMGVLAVLVTFAFYFILKFFGNASLFLSTLSIATSFVASYLTFKRSPFYAIGYAFNDLVLIGLWVVASFRSTAYLSMVICFVVFLVNDLYGFFNWQKIHRRQKQVQDETLAEVKEV